MKNILTISLLLLVFLSAQAQIGEYRTKDKKAIKLFEEAINYTRYDQFELCQLKLEAALERDPNFLDAQVMLGEIHMAQGNYPDAKTWLRKAIDTDPAFYPNALFMVANLELAEGNYEEAKASFERFMPYPTRSPKEKELARRGIENCTFAIEAMKHPVDFNPVNLGENVNSEHAEYFPALTADESMLLMTRRLPEPRSPVGANEDFFFSEKKDGEWMPAYNPGKPINSQNNEGAPTLSPDGKFIIFTTCALYGEYGPGRQGYGSCDLFIAKRIGKGWSKPRNMGRTINSPMWETQPSFASDGKTLYFIRGNPRQRNSADIYTSSLVDGKWTQATPLSDVINSDQPEESVFIHPDNQTLYFSSRGHTGMGGLDIFLSRKDENGEWTKPVNLGYPINTFRDENSFHVSASGAIGLIGSNRAGGYGELDLYSFELPEQIRPQPVTFLRGRITDAKTGQPLEARFELIDLETNETVTKSYSDEANGSYLVCIPVDKSYGLNANHPGYLFHSENFELKGVENITHYEKNIELQPIEPGRTVVLKNVFFDSDKFDLKPASLAELDRLVKLLEETNGLRIEISGHTDSQGSAGANQILSENRAKAVYDYLVTQGIAADRLMYAGYGQMSPIATNDTEEGRAQNRRTEFKVLE